MRNLDLAVLLFVFSSLSGCKNIPPYECKDPLLCVHLEMAGNQSCPLGNPLNQREYSIVNTNTVSKDTLVSFQQIQRRVGTPATITVYNNIRTVAPGRQNKEPIVCKHTNYINEGYDDNTVVIQSACFVGECPRTAPAVPGDPRPEGITCEALCDADDAACNIAIVNDFTIPPGTTGNKLSTLVSTLTNAPIPADVDLSALVNLSNQFTNTQTCHRDALKLTSLAGSRALSFYNAGATCPVAFALPGSTHKVIEVGFNSEWKGVLARGAGTVALASADPTFAPWIRVVKDDDVEEFDPVSTISAKTGRMTIAGRYKQCFQVRWNADRGADAD